MATVANYPDGTATAGPAIALLIDQPAQYVVDRHEYDDGGLDVNVLPCGKREWLLEYDGLSQSDLNTLRDHFNLAKGAVNDFSFYHRRDAVTHTGVRYASFRVGQHRKNWAVPVSITLVKY